MEATFHNLDFRTVIQKTRIRIAGLEIKQRDLESFLNKFELTGSNSSNLSCVESDEQITTKIKYNIRNNAKI
ncbi:hypothetical protein BpHYR1_029487 [Brachionus plicatilis]|uniref:Uncharacterized protein n=1 Tax=Brachionus plicatilis TaxID=10195 RepID=A0A3M7S2M7_BRAPC|nr:hypothetical protein BpHYR1_029487 [Brachionus plicatilis]